MPTKHNHTRYYSKSKNRKNLAKFDIKTGMIVNFPYSGNSDKRPLVFVMETNTAGTKSKESSFSGINLNYLSLTDINKFFVKVSTKKKRLLENL